VSINRKLTLIIPVLNSENILPGFFKELDDFFVGKAYLKELVFVW